VSEVDRGGTGALLQTAQPRLP